MPQVVVPSPASLAGFPSTPDGALAFDVVTTNRNVPRGANEEASGAIYAHYPALLDAINRAQFGVIVTSVGCRPAFVNAYAERLLSRRNGLMLNDGAVAALDPANTRVLRKAVEGACRGEIKASTTLLFPTTDASRSIVLHVPVSMYTNVLSNHATIFVCDPGQALPIDSSLLSRMYSLTKAEAALAILLIRGNSLEQAAERSFISIHTARTHLKRILLKTDTGRQTELLRVLLTCFALLQV